ncbi:MAG: hypothetical protein ACI4QH_00660, partial [Candidatus Fimimonas sp.]
MVDALTAALLAVAADAVAEVAAEEDDDADEEDAEEELAEEDVPDVEAEVSLGEEDCDCARFAFSICRLRSPLFDSAFASA